MVVETLLKQHLSLLPPSFITVVVINHVRVSENIDSMIKFVSELIFLTDGAMGLGFSFHASPTCLVLVVFLFYTV